jgi:hypothetical protein
MRIQTPYDEWLEAPYYDEDDEREERDPDDAREEARERARLDREEA